MSTKILIIDDDREGTRLLAKYLSQVQFQAIAAHTASEGMQLLQREAPALVLLDVMLPVKNGFELCREIRNVSSVPILMLTARGAIDDRLIGLESGADDYLAKPYEPKELLLRIQSILRRSRGTQARRSGILCSGDLVVNEDRASATLSGQDLALTQTEFSVLVFLMKNAGKTLSRDEIYQNVKGEKWDGADRAVDMIVSRLRTKLGDATKTAVYLKTMWGDGYRFVGEVQCQD